MGEHPEALLGTGIPRARLPRLHGIEGDKVAVRLTTTLSLTDDTTERHPLTDPGRERIVIDGGPGAR